MVNSTMPAPSRYLKSSRSACSAAGPSGCKRQTSSKARKAPLKSLCNVPLTAAALEHSPTFSPKASYLLDSNPSCFFVAPIALTSCSRKFPAFEVAAAVVALGHEQPELRRLDYNGYLVF